MTVTPLAIPDVLLIEPRVFRDDRGFFLETFHAERYRSYGLPDRFVQDNHSRSARGVLRGLHFQRRHPQGKLVRVVRGEVLDVAVDLRPGSATFGRHVTAVLSENDLRQLWIPPGFAHGFYVRSGEADFLYQCTDVYRPDDEGGIRWDDPDLGIDWGAAAPTVSPRDQQLPPLAALGPDDLPHA
jgi:dTDP-4-dehydrorhamnose 3,5-epimerase